VSTLLELVQALHRESGASGSAPTTVAGAKGEYKRLVNWIIDADMYIQNLYDNWKFLRATYEEVTSGGVKQLPAAQDPAWYDFPTFRIIEAGSTVEGFIEAVEYDDIKDEVRPTSTGVPFRVVVMPDDSLEVDGYPNDAHTIKCDYYLDPNAGIMSADTDVSLIPPRFHRVILGRALILYGNYENAPEIVAQGNDIYLQELARLENKQLPNKNSSRFRTGGTIEIIAE
jgi:hypothetical protein